MPKPSFSEDQMEKCLREVAKNDNRSFREICRDFKIAGSSVRTRLEKLKKIESGGKPAKIGRPTVINEVEEKELADCIAVLCKNGFSPSLDDIRIIVQDYVNANEVENPFINGKPGRRWMERFLAKNNLSLKRATLISKVRLDCTSNPFVIYDFYKTLSDVISDEVLSANQIWNMDETGFCLDPKKSMSVAPKGQKALKRTEGCQRENITVLAVCSASGRVLDPLIINQGAYFQQCWKADNALPNTFYGHSHNGWMTSQVMIDWFEQFLELVQERPILLLFDGHLTHFSIDVVKKALDNQVILIKLPPHTTDLMQPLDVGMFSPLKKAWDKQLSEHTGFGGSKGTIRRADFVNMLCSIWKESMPGKNAISGFRATGMFPVEMTKYPRERFDIRLLNKFSAWSDAGMPDDRSSFLENIEPVILPAADTDFYVTRETGPIIESETLLVETNRDNVLLNVASCSKYTTENHDTGMETHTISTPVSNLSEGVNVPPITTAAPPGFKWKYLLILVPESEEQQIRARKKSFEESILDIAKPPQPRKKLSRKRIGFNRTVVSQQDFVDELEKKEQEKKIQEEKKLARQELREQKKRVSSKKGKGKTKKQFRNEFVTMGDNENSRDSIAECDDIVQGNKDLDDEDNNNSTDGGCDSAGTDQSVEDQSSEASHYKYISNVWQTFSLPTQESDLVGKYVGAIFVERKTRPHLYIGKITKCFLNDNQGLPAALKIDCLKPKHGCLDNILEGIPSHLPPDIDVFPMHNVISKPLMAIHIGVNKIEFPEYPQIVSHFKYLKSMDRVAAHNKFVCRSLNHE